MCDIYSHVFSRLCIPCIYIYIHLHTHTYIYIYIIHDLLNTRPYMSHLKAKIRRAVFQTNSTK